MSNSVFVAFSSLLGIVWPIYTGLMCALAWRLFRRTRIPGSVLLAAGFGGSCVCTILSVMTTFTLNYQAPSSGGLPEWFITMNMLSSTLSGACNVIIVVGFVMLTGHLIRSHVPSSQEIKHG